MVLRLFVTHAVLNPCHQTSPLPNSTLGLWNQETIYLFPSPMFFSRTSATATTMLRKTLQFILDVLDCISALCLDFWVQRYGAFLKNAITNSNIGVTLFSETVTYVVIISLGNSRKNVYFCSVIFNNKILMRYER